MNLMMSKGRKIYEHHGMSYTRIYGIWKSIKGRCNTEKHTEYFRYGAKGIKVCDEWANSFESFRSWAIENGYSDTLTIDRINNDLGYFPSNCRWITPFEQNRNQKKNVMVTYKGKTQCLVDWSNELNIGLTTLRSRYRDGKRDDDLFAKPMKKPYQTNKKIMITYNGKTQCLKEWSKETGINYQTLIGRFNAGKSVDELFCKTNLKGRGKRSGRVDDAEL